MKMNQHILGLHYGSKGIIFTLDIALATTIVMVLLIASGYQVSKSDNQATAKLQLSRIGADVTAYLDHQGIFDSLNSEAIQNNLSSILTSNYDMKIRLTGDFPTIETQNNISTKRFVASGERIVVINGNPGTARYWIWLK